jgi:hypothetical protein
MNDRAPVLVLALLLGIFSSGSSAQVITQPTPVPLVTADSEAWYLAGEPIVYSGYLYYPAGAQVSFNPNEMVRSSSHFGVPLYVRGTDEPFSVVYVPLARGFVQPYMRRRAGDIAGTVGTAPPSGSAAMYSQPGAVFPAQAAGAPSLTAGAPADAVGQPRAPLPPVAARGEAVPMASTPAPSATAPPSRAVGNSGRAAQATSEVPTHTRIGPRPLGLNAIFIDYRDRRWFSEGPAVEIDRARMTEVGDYHGFPVFADRDVPDERIYVVTSLGGSLVAPYAERKPR